MSSLQGKTVHSLKSRNCTPMTGGGTFTEMTGTPFEGVEASSIAFADVDGDNDQDVLITGQNSSFARISKLYTNDGMISSTDDFTIGDSFDFVLFPNPSASSTVFLTFEATETGAVTLKVLGVNGTLLLEQNEFVIPGHTTFSVDIASLPTGSYFMQLENGKKLGTAKFIVQ
ncbi:MAG: T9SS type A sorting domain-containing protein [Bacteroidota bacterium]